MFIVLQLRKLPKQKQLWEFSFFAFLVPFEGRTILFFHVSSFFEFFRVLFEFIQPTIELFEFALHRLNLMA